MANHIITSNATIRLRRDSDQYPPGWNRTSRHKAGDEIAIMDVKVDDDGRWSMWTNRDVDCALIFEPQDVAAIFVDDVKAASQLMSMAFPVKQVIVRERDEAKRNWEYARLHFKPESRRPFMNEHSVSSGEGLELYFAGRWIRGAVESDDRGWYWHTGSLPTTTAYLGPGMWARRWLGSEWPQPEYPYEGQAWWTSRGELTYVFEDGEWRHRREKG